MTSKTERQKIQDVIDKTEDNFEEKLTYLSAGSLGLTLTFIEKIVPLENSIVISFLVAGWGLLVLTLLLNLSSHMFSKHLMQKTQKEMDDSNSETDNNSIYLKVIKRNRIIDFINWVTVILLIFGISSIIAFVSINSFHKASKNERNSHIDKQVKHTTDSINNIHTTNNYFYYGK